MGTILKLLSYLDALAYGVFILTILVLLPVSFIRRAHVFSAYSLITACWIIGVQLLVLSIQIGYHYIGAWALGIAVFTAGTFSVPLAIGLTLFNGTWTQIFVLLGTIVFIWCIRLRIVQIAA